MSIKRYKAVDIIKGLAMVLVILVHYNQSFYSNISLLRFFQMGCQVFLLFPDLVLPPPFQKNAMTHPIKSQVNCFTFQGSNPLHHRGIL